MSPMLIEAVGYCAATLTTICWVPQAWRTIRTRDTRAISLWTQVLLGSGMALWLAYGIFIASWPVALANAISLVLVATILGMKLRYG